MSKVEHVQGVVDLPIQVSFQRPIQEGVLNASEGVTGGNFCRLSATEKTLVMAERLEFRAGVRTGTTNREGRHLKLGVRAVTTLQL